MYASYNDDIEFLIVYIREAHPNLLKPGNKTGIVGRPKTLTERVILATECVAKYKFTIPMVIDGMDGKVNSDYKAAPVRVTVTDIDGKVVFYGGPGPFDFRLPPVERTLKKLIANGGRMPSPPVPKWGQPVNGLRCGLSIDPDKLVLGEAVAARLTFENTTDKNINLYFATTDAIKNLVINNSNGQTLRMEAATGDRWSRLKRRGNPAQRIAPGQILENEVEGKIVGASDQEAFTAGQFHVVYNLEVNDQTLVQIQPAPTRPVWSGKLSSGTCTITLDLPHQAGCIDCHGDADYHHKETGDCTICHVGIAGSDDFDVNKESCAQCHPRSEVQGRRQILGPGGEFEMASKHISGKIEDKHCLLCHDNRQHRTGVVSLIDPDSGGTRAWTGARTEFCLTCHDGDPPAGISFPAISAGSGYDKSEFRGSTHALGGQSCSFCHNPHGSSYPSLLKDIHNRRQE